MRKLTYWVAEATYGGSPYSYRAKTLKQLKADMKADRDSGLTGYYEPPIKVSVQYRDAFDLMVTCLQEGSGCWEYGDFVGGNLARPQE